MLTNKDRKKPKNDYQCPVHHKKGSQFCQTCGYFICIECIKEGIHNNHDICDIDEMPELKEKIKKIEKFHKDVQNIGGVYKEISEEFEKYYDLSVEDMEWMANRLKTKLDDCIDTTLNKQKQELSSIQQKFQNFKKDSEILKSAQENVFKLDHKKSEPEVLKEELKKSLMTNEAGEVVDLV